ncbi:RND family transporter [Methanomethylovorans sp.]|uniref:efflux RND transporter permease subunit n=1 Tax=Methanomethylovorans sp. TaxID=2758717 RepID=UPI001BD1D249|nr:RND family transporter [Methanomethylovorans sp.]
MSVKQTFENIGVIVEKSPKTILAIAIILMFLSFIGAGLIEQKSGTDTFVKKNSEIYQNYDHLYKQNFGNEVIIVLVESDDVRESEVLKAIDDFDMIIGQDKDVENTVSMASLIKSAAYSATGRSEIPEDEVILALIDQLPSAYVEQFMPETTHTLIMVQMPGSINEDNKKRVLAQVERTIEVVDFPAGTTAVATGEPAYMIAMSEEMISNLGTMLVLAFILMIIGLKIVFRHVRWSLLPIPVILVGLVYTFGAMGLLSIPMTMASMAVFPILIGLGADYAIQFQNRIEEELTKGESAEEAIINTIKHTGPAVAVAVVATSLGFIALFISPVPMIQDFGKMSLVGVILCYLVSMFVLVALLYRLDRRSLEKEAEKKLKKELDENGTIADPTTVHISPLGKFLAKISLLTTKHYMVVIVLASGFAIAGLYADEHVGVQTDTKDFVPPDMKALQDLNKLNRIMGGSDQLNIIIRADDIMAPDLLQWMVDFSVLEEERHNHITGSGSIGSLVYSAYGSIPSDKDTIISITDSMSSVITDQYIEGGNLGVLNLKLETGLQTQQVSNVIKTVESDLQWYAPPPGVTVTVTGNKVAETSIIGALTSGRTDMGYLGMTIIFAGMLLIYKDWIKSLATILPIVMVTGWLGGVMYLSGMEYNPLTATLGALAIGIGAEFTILMLERYFEERDKGLEPLDAMETAALKIGPAILASGFTVIFGFSALVASSFPMLRGFGIVTVIAVAFSLFSTIVVLPPIMVNLDRWRSGRKALKKNIEDSKVSI